MKAIISKVSNRLRTRRAVDPGSMSRNHTPGTAVDMNNPNFNILFGSGTITNNNHNITNIDARPHAPPKQHVSDVSVSATLPAMPVVFHGQDKFIDEAVRLLTGPDTARLAILGAGGMGKTTVALAILHDDRIATYYSGLRYFLSCEALIGADALVVSLAKVLGLPPSDDLLTAVVISLSSRERTILTLDNLETVWLAGGGPVAAVDEVLGRLAQIPSLSLIITCRGTDLPQSVEWSNTHSAILEPFSLEAAQQTFRDRAQRVVSESDEDIVAQLLAAVDRMPLAVSLLGQLARRGNSVSVLLERWHREHSELLRTHGPGRMNSVEVSIELSIVMLCTADDSREALHLLSLCCMLPDGLRPDVFNLLRPQFKYIDRARDTLCAYALLTLGKDRTLKTLSPIRHHVLQQYPAKPKYHDALCSIYFDVASRLPDGIDEQYKQLAESAAPEMGNLSSLLLSLVDQPSAQLVTAVIRFTRFMRIQQPTTTLAFALLPCLEDYPQWKASCLHILGDAQTALCDYGDALSSFLSAVQLFSVIGDLSRTAECKRLAGEAYRVICEYDKAEKLLSEALATCTELGDEFEEAWCMMSLGELKREKKDYPAAIEHLNAARETLGSLGNRYSVAQCSEFLGGIHLDQDNLVSAVAELETARATYISLGARAELSQCTLSLSQAHRHMNEYVLADLLLCEAEAICNKANDRLCIAGCDLERGRLRCDQERWEEAVVCFTSALHLYEILGAKDIVEACRAEISNLEPKFRASKVTIFI